MNKIAVDTNVLLYFLDRSEPKKRAVAGELLLQVPVWNTQSLSELINVLRRRWRYSKSDIIQVVQKLQHIATYRPLSETAIQLGFELVEEIDL